MAQIHFRSDNWHNAQMRLKNAEWAEWTGVTKEEWDATPLPVAGDIWRVHWHGTNAVAGYVICCPKCGDVHHWTTATNCAKEPGKDSCVHSGVGSCWQWTGSAEEGTLSANPSLLCHSCGFHGWLRNGQLTE